MSKDGRIGNRAALKVVADFLQMEGVRRFPMALNLDMVQPVVDISAVGAEQPASAFQAFNSVNFQDVGFNIGGISTFSRTIFDHANNPALIGRDARVIGVTVEVNGPADAADTPMILEMNYTIGLGPIAIVHLRNWEMTSAAGLWTRVWTLGGSLFDTSNNQGYCSSGWGGFLPAGQSIEVVVRRTAGNFPALSTGTVRAFEVNVPTGRRLPG